VTSSEFRRWLQHCGCSFGKHKGSHLKVFRGRFMSVLPVHGKKELPKGLIEAIKKQLGLKGIE
jgi:mRNA interferase HicA